MKELEEVATSLGVRPGLQLGVGSPPTSTGPHTVTVLKAKKGTAKQFQSDKTYETIVLLVEEDGVQKTYSFPLYADGDKGATDKPHYLFNRFLGIENGTEVVMEMKKEGARTYIDVKVPGEEFNQDTPDNEPVVDLDEEGYTSRTSSDTTDGDESEENEYPF